MLQQHIENMNSIETIKKLVQQAPRFNIEDVDGCSYSSFIESSISEIEEMTGITSEEKLQAFTAYALDVKIQNKMWTFNVENPLDYYTLTLDTQNPQAITTLKIFHIFSRLKIWANDDLSNTSKEEVLLNIFSQRPDLFEG